MGQTPLISIALTFCDYLAGGQGAVPCTERRTGATLTKQDGNG